MNNAWLVQDKVFSISLHGEPDLAQIERLGTLVSEKVGTLNSQQLLYLLVDTSQLKSLPRTVGALKDALSWLGDIGVGCLIIHSSPSQTNCVLLRLAARAEGIPCITFRSEAEAHAQLARLGLVAKAACSSGSAM